jgi:hypothetical protein
MVRRRPLASLRADPSVQVLATEPRWLIYPIGTVLVLIWVSGVFFVEEPVWVPIPRWVLVVFCALAAVVTSWTWFFRYASSAAYLTANSYVEQRTLRTIEIPFSEIEHVHLPSYGLIVVRLRSGRSIQLKALRVRGKIRDSAHRLLLDALERAGRETR